jgi:hypothetical protein
VGGPTPSTTEASTGPDPSSGAQPGSSDAAGPESTSSDASGAASTSSTADSTSESTGGEVCLEGTFVGYYSGDFEYFEFSPCEGGEPAWFTPNFPQECRSTWVTVEGSMCGPGGYGHLGYYRYELRGEIVEGPCDASCGDDPPPDRCGTFEEVCVVPECSIIEQTCADGMRCVPSSLAGTPPWVSSRCVPVAADPQPLGAPCTRAAAWNDDCDVDGYCPADGDEPVVCRSLCGSDFDCAADEQCSRCDISRVFEYDQDLRAGVCGVDDTAC